MTLRDRRHPHNGVNTPSPGKSADRRKTVRSFFARTQMAALYRDAATVLRAVRRPSDTRAAKLPPERTKWRAPDICHQDNLRHFIIGVTP
jgi:hypothetical protein